MTSLTTNGAVALQSTGNHIVDFFMMFVRGIDDDVIDKYMTKCWQMDPKKTVAVIFNARDRQNGKKEKNVSNRAMIWLKKNKYYTYCKNLTKYVTKYGRWKDALYIATKCPEHTHEFETKLVADQLKADKDALNLGQSVSLCAKWASSENDKFDKNFKLAHKIAEHLYTSDEPKMMQKYRQEYLAPLRKQIEIVESYMTQNRWKQIQYDKVPSIATKRLKNAFTKHDPEGYAAFLQQVSSGEKKIKVTGILPHELVKYYIDTENTTDETIELQWKALVENVKSQGTFKNMLAVVDTSGSMYSGGSASARPIDVSIALGLLISECCEGSFHRKILPFCDKPTLFEVKGNTLLEQVTYIKTYLQDGMSTNFEAVFDLLIDTGVMYDVLADKMPTKIVVLSDMQFDDADQNTVLNEETLHQTIIKKYQDTPYTPPQFIYWNLNGTNDGTFPVKAVADGVAMISGFSEQLLKVFMNNDKFDAEQIVYEILLPYENEVDIDELDTDETIIEQAA
jgi:hypothetical protein